LNAWNGSGHFIASKGPPISPEATSFPGFLETSPYKYVRHAFPLDSPLYWRVYRIHVIRKLVRDILTRRRKAHV
jgi:hypothetical protein